MTDSVDDVFKSLIEDTTIFVESVSATFLHNASKAIAEKWADNIIDILTKKQLDELKDSTIKSRESRNQNILGPDYPLLETGEWITYIEFKIVQHDDYDYIEIGVWDDTSQIGHTNDVTPLYIATIDEYGYSKNNLYIKPRYLFTTSELKIYSEIDSVINTAYDSINDFDIVDIPVSKNLHGKIIRNGSQFEFRWDE